MRRSQRRKPRAAPAQAPGRVRPAPPGAAPLALLAAWALLLTLAPAGVSALWGVNGFASVPAPDRVLLLGAAAACAGLAWTAFRGRGASFVAVVGLALLVAFPLREKIHFLGDTNSRIGALSIFALGLDPRPIQVWARQIHAQPLDLVVDFLLPAGLTRIVPLEIALSLLSFSLAVVFLAGALRLVRQAGAPSGATLPLFAALVLTGSLEAFAGYLESAGLVLVASVLWWSAAIGPVRSRWEGIRLAVAWLVLLLSHRLAVVLLVPHLVRVLGPAWNEDGPEGRRWAAGGTIVAAIAGGAVLTFTGASERIALDTGAFVAALRTPGAALRAAVDGANLLLLVAGPAFAAALVAGPSAVRAALADPRVRLAGWAAALLLPLAFLVPAAPATLGGHRDWDIGVLLGLTLSLSGILVLSRLPEARLRGALAVALPVLALGAGGWLAANADESVALARAHAAVSGWPRMAEAQQSQALLFLGSDLATRGRHAEAARYYEQSFDLVPAPNRGIHAATNWARAGDFAAARRILARIKGREGLDASAASWIRDLEAQMDQIVGAGGAGGAAGPPPAPAPREWSAGRSPAPRDRGPDLNPSPGAGSGTAGATGESNQ